MKTYKLSLILLLTASWLFAACAGAQTRTAARQSSGVCRVSAPARGADLGALINACDQRLGSGAGTISVSGGGNIATRVVVSPRHTLLFAGGVYTASTPGTVMWLKDSSALRCEAQAALQESTAPNVNAGLGSDGTPVFTIVSDFAGGNRNGDASRNIQISGCRFSGARRDFNSAYQTVALGNCRDCSATGNSFEQTRTIGLQVGGGSTYGNFARNVTLDGNTFRGVASQNLAVTNGAAIRVTNNRFYAPGQPGGPGVTVIDVEPNTGDVIDGLDISRNLIDATDSAHDNGSWKTTNGIAVNGGNPTKKFAGVVVRDNTLVAGRKTDQGSKILYANVIIRAAHGVIVRDNRMNHGSRCIVLDDGSSDNLVEGNTIENCGSGSTYPIHLQAGVRRNRIVNNVLTADPADAIGALLLNAPHRERSIVEDAGADENVFSGNVGDVTVSGRRSRVESRR
jgi:parallel beta-helix repeat protein